MKTTKIITLLCAVLLLAVASQAQDRVMRVHSGGNVVYATNTSQVDSITFHDGTLKYPKEIPFEDYSLADASCQWANLANDNTIVVINTNEELNQYITCIGSEYSAIDFSKHTLLLANGTTPNGIVEISNRLLQLSVNKYRLDIEILLNDADVMQPWTTALIVNKLSEESAIEIMTILKH